MSTKRSLVVMTILLLGLLPGGSRIAAQERQRSGGPPDPGVRIERAVEAQDAPGSNGDIITFKVLSPDMRFGDSVVKGVPYSAKAIIERSQTLADGTHINLSSSILYYRDSEGRTRRDEAVSAIGPIGAARNAPPAIFINDPVAGIHYFLDPVSKEAQRITIPKDDLPPGRSMPPPGEKFNVVVTGPIGEGGAIRRTPPAEKTESLGKQTIEGVEAEGTRSLITIPTDQIGNDRPIEIVTEQWYSPALQAVILSKHNDPRVGEHTYRLTNISLTEPDHSLFEVPSDYKVEEPSNLPMKRRRIHE